MVHLDLLPFSPQHDSLGSHWGLAETIILSIFLLLQGAPGVSPQEREGSWPWFLVHVRLSSGQPIPYSAGQDHNQEQDGGLADESGEQG